MMFRQVALMESLKGKILLHSMPARYESWDDFRNQLVENKVDRIICLVEAEEIRRKSPSYFHAIESHLLPCPKLNFPIPDFNPPNDREAFAKCVQLVAGYIMSGESILIHCAGGVGRTGMFATCVLQCFGMDNAMAEKLIKDARSGAETCEQSDLVRWHFMHICNDKDKNENP